MQDSVDANLNTPKLESTQQTESESNDLVAKAKNSVRRSAFNLLARREHSLSELKKKLGQKYSDSTLIDSVLQDLIAEGLQSDERFVESFVNAQVQRQRGPMKIAYDLRQKQVNDELIQSALCNFSDQWVEIATALVEKKYGFEPPEDLKEKQRRMRFVMQRGFPADICYRLFD